MQSTRVRSYIARDGRVSHGSTSVDRQEDTDSTYHQRAHQDTKRKGWRLRGPDEKDVHYQKRDEQAVPHLTTLKTRPIIDSYLSILVI